MDYLAHYGILGMRWGIRRYQNKDGSLTPEGKKRYNELLSEFGSDARRNAEISKKYSGIKTVDAHTDLLAKGSSVYRMSSRSNESVSDRRKYASITEWDRKHYQNMGQKGEIGGTRKRFETRFEAKKDVKIASAKAVEDYIIENYGKVKVKDIPEAKNVKMVNRIDKQLKKMTLEEVYNELGRDTNIFGRNLDSWKITEKRVKTKTEPLSKEDKKIAYAAYSRIYDARHIITRAAFQYLYSDINSKAFDHFKSKGYDAIVDLEDYGHLAQYPVIFLDPKESMSVADTKKYSKR